MVDQEEQRLLNSEAILRNLMAEFKRQGVKVRKIDEDTFSYKGVHFDLQDAPTDTLNGIVYLIAPSKQTIPVREENLAETVKMVVDYVENQHEMENVSKGASAYAVFDIEDFDDRFRRTSDWNAFVCSCGRGNIHTHSNSIDVNHIGDVIVPTSAIIDEIYANKSSEEGEIIDEALGIYLSVYPEPESFEYEEHGIAISSVFVATEGVNEYARRFSVNGGWSHRNISVGESVECEGSWYLDVDALFKYIVNGQLVTVIRPFIIAVSPMLVVSQEGAEAYETLWDDSEDDYYASAKKSRMLSKSTLQNTADRIAMDCQCDSAEIHNLNGEYILMMPVLDSDCEYYYDEYDIYQEEMDGITYNCVNLSQLVKGMRKMRKSMMLSNFDFKFDPHYLDLAIDEAMADLENNPDYKRHGEFMERWNNPSGSKPNVVLDADDIRQPIRDWYTTAYPDDDLGMYLSDITFHDLHTGISQGLDVYDHIGVGDSIVRERLFDRLAELKSTSYDAIYDMWLGARKGMRKSVPSFSQMMKSVRDGSFKAKMDKAYGWAHIDGESRPVEVEYPNEIDCGVCVLQGFERPFNYGMNYYGEYNGQTVYFAFEPSYMASFEAGEYYNYGEGYYVYCQEDDGRLVILQHSPEKFRISDIPRIFNEAIRNLGVVKKAYLSDDYPTNTSGNYVVARKINGESMYNESFDTKEDYDRFCQRLESSGWNRGREYPEENGAYITYWKDTD